MCYIIILHFFMVAYFLERMAYLLKINETNLLQQLVFTQSLELRNQERKDLNFIELSLVMLQEGKDII